MVSGYCMKCKAKREIAGAKKLVKSGRHFMTGTCTKCGTKVFKIVAKS